MEFIVEISKTKFCIWTGKGAGERESVHRYKEEMINWNWVLIP